jgi:choline kinase
LASGNAILLAAGFYDRIHGLDSENKPKGTTKNRALYGKESRSQRLFNGLW